MGSVIPYIALCVSLLAIGVSYYCFCVTQQRSIRPVLVFSHDGRDDKWASGWHVENVGCGPAVNVLLAAGNIECVWNEQTALLLPALGGGSKFRLTWIHHPGSLVATYADSEGRTYTSVCVHSRNHISGKNRFPALKPMKYAYQITNDQGVA